MGRGIIRKIWKVLKDAENRPIYYIFCGKPEAVSEIWVRRGELMGNEKIYQMDFSKVYYLLVSKVEKKGRTRQEVDEVIRWLTGYNQPELEKMLERPVAYGDFFLNAPELNENRKLIKGVVCGIRVEDIEEPLMQEIRYLDKLVDELAKGKVMDKILRK